MTGRPATDGLAAGEFAALIAPLGPFEPAPHVAVGVSGGADSMALALLAAGWAARCTALVVDHGLREESAAEASAVRARLAARGIAARILKLAGLQRGPRLAERARAARLAVLEAACVETGILHLLLAHHAADQAETVAMRMLRGSGSDGLAGMAALRETAGVRVLRPLLTVPPVRLRSTLRAAGVHWVDDPSNRDPAAQRARLRALRRDRDGVGPATAAAVEAAAARGRARAVREAARAAWLGRHATLHDEGRIDLDSLPDDSETLGEVLRVVAGRARPPPADAVGALLARPRAATLGGVLIRPIPSGWRLLPEPGRTDPPACAPTPLAAAGFAVAPS